MKGWEMFNPQIKGRVNNQSIPSLKIFLNWQQKAICVVAQPLRMLLVH